MRPSDMASAALVMTAMGVNFVIAKAAIEVFPPLWLMAMRYCAVAALALPFARAPRGRMVEVWGISVTLGCLHFAFMFNGLKDLDAAAAAIAIQLQAPFAVILAAIVLKDFIGWRRGLGMALAFAGVVLMAGEPRFEGVLAPLGLVVFSGFLWAISNLQAKRLSEVDGVSLNAWVSAFAAPQVLLMSFFLEDGQLQSLTVAEPIHWAALAYMILAVSLFGYTVWYRLLRRYPVTWVTPFTLLPPVVGVASGAAFLGEELTWRMLAGGAITLIGVGVITLRRPELRAGPAGGSGQ